MQMIDMVCCTDVGKIRSINEDTVALLPRDDGNIVAIVADGMGGHKAGDVASKMLVDRVGEELSQIQNLNVLENKAEVLQQSIDIANQDIYALANENQDYKGMGTTVVASITNTHSITLVHAGDSRAYILRSEGLYQITEDHSYVNFLLKHGQITESEAQSHPQRNVIVNAVGTSDKLETEAIELPWIEGEILLLCSDGLTTEVSESEIGVVLSSSEMTLAQKGDYLLSLALEHGGKDNVSLILLENMFRDNKEE